MNLTQLVDFGTRSFVLGCTFLFVAIRPAMAQLNSNLDVFHIDPFDGFDELTVEPIAPISHTFEECLTNPDATFVMTRRGGLADDPTQPLRDRTLWQDLRPLDSTETLELTINESEPVNLETLPPEDLDAFNYQNCQVLFDNQIKN
jgi:hypothetical protein